MKSCFMYKSAYFIVHRNIVTDMVMLSEQHYAVLEKLMRTILSYVASEMQDTWYLYQHSW